MTISKKLPGKPGSFFRPIGKGQVVPRKVMMEQFIIPGFIWAGCAIVFIRLLLEKPQED